MLLHFVYVLIYFNLSLITFKAHALDFSIIIERVRKVNLKFYISHFFLIFFTIFFVYIYYFIKLTTILLYKI
jgi:hypothetical protein